MTIRDIMRFIALTHEFQNVERRIYVKGKDVRENDVEHSYQLALVAWFLVSTKKLSLDKDLVVQYALIHDLVEVYAGDTYFYTTDETERVSKMAREREAAERLRAEFPEFAELHDLIDQYERKEDPESKFVYALDKVLPVLNIYLDDGRTWQKENVTLDMLIDGKKDKVKLSKHIEPYFNELMEILRDEHDKLFNGPVDN